MGTAAHAEKVEEEIRAALSEAFQPTVLKVTNDSARHHGHAGDDGSGASHFAIEIAAPAFEERPMVECHRMIYAALDRFFKAGLHALQIRILRE